MKKTNRSSGITLIALIITVIVMIILVGVTVNVALNGELFDTAKQAASGMEMAQIRERAEVVKANLFAEAQSNNSIILSKTELKNRLLQEFEGSTSEGSKVIVEDGKYDIIIKNTDLDLDVVEHSDNPYSTEPSSLVGLDYTSNKIEAEEELCVMKISLNLTRLMNSTQYAELRAKQDATKGEITPEEKEQITIEYISEMYGMQFNSIDEAVLYDINSMYGKNYTTLEECLQDETVQSEWGSTKEQLYYSWCYWIIPTEGNEYTKEEVIDFWYNDSLNNIYYNEFNKYTRNLSLYVENNGKQELLKNSINLNNEKITVDYGLGKNGKYEFVVKTNTGEEITKETVQINNIISPNPYVLTEDEAEGIWETDGKGTIRKYIGQDKEVTVPILIGTEYITKIGDIAFYSNVNITNVKMSDEITALGNRSFYSCSNLESIRLSESISRITGSTYDGGVFESCSKLNNVVIPKNVKSLDWYAFKNCTGLTNIMLNEGIEEIKHKVFAGCTALGSITIPNSVIGIRTSNADDGSALFGDYYYDSFTGCTNLTNIYFAPGDNPIPDGKPWGAPNENLVVTKLTE